ncbi:MAG: NADH-quinone oxidoreductase subunit N [Fuerstiella sp.]|nr:NADH-quinone oxidoreductase subunit N [Fuerstiella sp.]
MFSQLIQNLIDDTLDYSLGYFEAELWLCGTIVALLLFRLLSMDRVIPTSILALAGAVAATVAAWFQLTVTDGSQTFFTGMLIHDQFSVYFRLFLSLFLALTIVLTILTGIPDNEDSPDFYTLLLGATIGMMIMASANNLLMLFIGVEMASVPSYAMVGFLKGRRSSSEAALKYVVYGAGAAGVMLYGVSLIVGILGTGDMGLLADRLRIVAENGMAGLGDPDVRLVALGTMLIMVGLAFKLSLVPFHFWCPDAFEGASAEVGGFLSVASKAGAFALLVRFSVALSGDPSGAELMTAFGIGLGVVAIGTMTFGNLAAYGQSNIKRMLAYSTIAHAGYMLMAVSAMLVMQNSSQAGALGQEINACLGGLLYYLAVYLFMNLGAFAVVALIRNYTFSEEIDSYAGLIRQSPALCVCMVFCMISLVGIPPFGGFFAKLMIFGSVYKAGDLHWSMYVLLAAGIVNTVISLFYYLRVLKTMIIDERPADARAVTLPNLENIYIGLLGAFVLLLGCAPIIADGLSVIAGEAAGSIFSAIVASP